MDRKKESKKILFVTTKEIEKHCLEVIKWLKEKGYEIHIASESNEEIQYCDNYFNLPFSRSKIKTYKLLKQIIKENNYEFIQCYTFLGATLTRLVTKKTKTKVIYISEKFQFYKKSKFIKWLIYYPIEKYLSKYTDMLITTNEEDYILAKNKFNCNVKLVNGMGINEQAFSKKLTEQERNQYFEEFNLDKEDCIFLSIGELNKNNNQIIQIEAIMHIIAEYKNIKLLIVGEGHLKEFYNNIIIKYGLDKNIKLIGEREDVIKLLKLSDYFLTTIKKEKIPINVIKAMFANKPIIASRIEKHKELLKNENLVNLNNANELISKLEKCIITGKRKVIYDVEKYDLGNVIDKIKKYIKSDIFCQK